MTKKHFCVVGSPIEHSLSPKIHNAAYRFLGLDWDYTKQEVLEGNLRSFLDEAGKDFSGLSVTMPLKREAAILADRSDEIVETIGVANTLRIIDTQIIASNTDVFGVTKALEASFQTGISKVSLLGAGATSLSALYALHIMDPRLKVSVFVRDLSRTELISKLGHELGMELDVLTLGEYSNTQDLTISTIPSSSLNSLNLNHQSGWLLNVNYGSPDAGFKDTFDETRVIPGEIMLIWQAIGQIRLFLNGDASKPLDDEAALFDEMVSAL